MFYSQNNETDVDWSLRMLARSLLFPKGQDIHHSQEEEEVDDIDIDIVDQDS